MDSLFACKVTACTPNPQGVAYTAMHQDYSPAWVGENEGFKPESHCGKLIVDNLLKGNKGHYGPLEHPQITFSIGYFPHSVMQQLRTHRVGISFDVQSFRYTSASLVEVVTKGTDIERAVYLRPVGTYSDRQGGKYEYTFEQRSEDLAFTRLLLEKYTEAVQSGMPEEQARGLAPFDYRQHFVMSVNARSLMHLLDLRSKADAQIECQWLCQFLMFEFRDWMPEVAAWYETHRYTKALLAP